MPLFRLLIAALLVMVAAVPADAFGLDEVRVGVLAHDVPILGLQRERGVDLNAELLFATPVPDSAVADVGPAWRWLVQPRVNLGVEGSTAGQTSQAYAGLTWTPWSKAGAFGLPGDLFFNVSFGPAINNGRIYSLDGSRLNLGANLLFRESVEIGYRWPDGIGVSVYFDHSSNGGIGTYNDGLNNLGVRVGYRF